MASVGKRPLEPKPSPQEWLNVKNEIERLYVIECHNLRYVAHVLQHRRGFSATLRMFKSRIKEWNFDQKTIRQADWRYMFQQYVLRKKANPPKETIFRICQARHGEVTKYKTIKHIRTYMRRKQVSEDEFLAAPSDGAHFPHIRPLTPPLSPAPSSASASPLSQADSHPVDATTPASGADSGCLHPAALHHRGPDAFRPMPPPRAPAWHGNHAGVSSVGVGASTSTNTPHDRLSSSSAETGCALVRAPPLGRRADRLSADHLSADHASRESSAAANEILLDGSQRMAIQTLGLDKRMAIQTVDLDKRILCEDFELYRSVARSPSLSCSDVSDIDDDLSAIDLTRTLSDFDEDVYDAQDRRSLVLVQDHTDLISARLHSFKPDVDEARAFRWASRYFLACILQGRMKFTLARAARASATKIFERMLESETRSPSSVPRPPPYIPSNRSRFILSGLTLMTTVLKAHGRDDMLKKFLVDSRRSIADFFQMENHPLSAPYSYILSLMDHAPFDDEAWEATLSSAHTTIRHVWNGGPNAVVSYYYWAWHVLKRKRYAQAIDQLNICYAKASEMFGDYHIFTINCLSTIARALSEQGQYQKAMYWLRDTIKRSQEALGPDHPFCYKLIERLGDLHQQLGDLAAAEATFRDVVEGRKKSLGLHHGHTSYVAKKLADLLEQQGQRAESDKFVRQLDEEHEEQQLQHYKEKKYYFPDSRQERFTHPSLNLRRLIDLH